jgi:hypothetical protein
MNNQTTNATNDGFDRLQHLLLDLRAGDEVVSSEAARLTGLREEVCRTMFERLTSVGLMSCEADGRFVRRTLDAFGR